MTRSSPQKSFLSAQLARKLHDNMVLWDSHPPIIWHFKINLGLDQRDTDETKYVPFIQKKNQ